MRKGYLSSYFTGAAAKRLSPVETDPSRSNQHEFNGVARLRQLFGDSPGKQVLPARFIYLRDSGGKPVTAEGSVTWYDARARSVERTGRSEHRLYFPATPVSRHASAGDLLLLARRPDGRVLVMVAKAGSTIAGQLLWLFGIEDDGLEGFSVRSGLDAPGDRLGYAARIILGQVGIESGELEENRLDEMLARFRGGFPPTREFSAYARATLPDVHPADGADGTLLAWLEREEILFRTLERELVRRKLETGVAERDVDGYLSYSLSVLNRRKSRAGSALENHLEQIFLERGIRFDRSPVTENRSRPDFLFPGAAEYRDPAFDATRLAMLAAKSTCKDRWRQVLSEAERIPKKHLMTVEPAISEAQTGEMRSRQLQLVVPAPLLGSFTSSQRNWLMTLEGFIGLVDHRQRMGS